MNKNKFVSVLAGIMAGLMVFGLIAGAITALF